MGQSAPTCHALKEKPLFFHILLSRSFSSAETICLIQKINDYTQHTGVKSMVEVKITTIHMILPLPVLPLLLPLVEIVKDYAQLETIELLKKFQVVLIPMWDPVDGLCQAANMACIPTIEVGHMEDDRFPRLWETPWLNLPNDESKSVDIWATSELVRQMQPSHQTYFYRQSNKIV